jgi:predicted alpha-1,6-mannanase (GH76 family)
LLVDTNADQCAVDADCAGFAGMRACRAGICVPIEAGPDAPGGDGASSADSAVEAGPDALSDAHADTASSGDGPPVDAASMDASDGATLDPTTANLWADDAVEHMMLAFWQQHVMAGYLSTLPGGTAPTGYWTFAEAWDAVLDAAARHGGARFLGTVQTFYLSQGSAGWSSSYFDDENWMTLALIRAYDLTKTPAFLMQAQALYADIMTAWDTTCCLHTGGGLWWDRAHTQKSTSINAGAVISGARLYERTMDSTYLTFANQAYSYWTSNMVDSTTGHVFDHVSVAADGGAGAIDSSKFTYNEGLMIGAAVELARATGNVSSLTLAHTVATYLLQSETVSTPYGPVLSDGACGGDCEQFKGIAARYLALLYQTDTTHQEYRALLEASARAAHELARDPSSGLFAADWSTSFGSQSTMLLVDATSSAAMVLSAVASLAGPPPADPSGTYEAEETTLHGVGLEATNTGYSGWGYVAGWNADGQYIDFLVDVPTAAAYDLTFRYSAGAGNSSRLVYANGANAVPNQLFAGTSGWTTYSNQIVTVILPAGPSTVSLVYNQSMGSTNYLNLDRLNVSAH